MTQGGNDYTFTTFEASDIMHRAASFCRASNSSHEYGNGESYTATEVHFLKYVVENPGYPLLSWHTAGIRRGRQPPDADEAGALRTPLPGAGAV